MGGELSKPNKARQIAKAIQTPNQTVSQSEPMRFATLSFTRASPSLYLSGSNGLFLSGYNGLFLSGAHWLSRALSGSR